MTIQRITTAARDNSGALFAETIIDLPTNFLEFADKKDDKIILKISTHKRNKDLISTISTHSSGAHFTTTRAFYDYYDRVYIMTARATNKNIVDLHNISIDNFNTARENIVAVILNSYKNKPKF